MFHGNEAGAVRLEKSAGGTMKRKRPSMIDIPVLGVGFDEFVKESKLSNRFTEIEVEGDGYSVYCRSGKRGEVMEDRYVAIVSRDSNQAFFGVFDGHGGPDSAEYAARNLEKNIMKEVLKRRDEDIERAVNEGYLITDFELLKEDIQGGTCSVTAFMYKGNLVVSNIGDCRAVVSQGGIVEALTMDHKPSRDDERERIERLGGYVDCCHGVWRVHGSLAVSRAIGDHYLKPWVIAEPTTKVFKITPKCEFVILASDGLWDKVTNQEAIDIARPFVVNVEKPKPILACKELVEMSQSRGSSDDISVMLIQLTHFITEGTT